MRAGCLDGRTEASMSVEFGVVLCNELDTDKKGHAQQIPLAAAAAVFDVNSGHIYNSRLQL
jgi:hypothetical protein